MLPLPIVLFALIIHVSHGALVVESDSSSFRVLVNQLAVFHHSNTAPMFYISETLIDFTEHHGNFRINETIEAGPVLMNSFSLHEETNDDERIVWTVTLSNAQSGSSAIVSRRFLILLSRECWWIDSHQTLDYSAILGRG